MGWERRPVIAAPRTSPIGHASVASVIRLAYTAPTGAPGRPFRDVRRGTRGRLPALTVRSDQRGGPRMAYRNEILMNQKSLKLGLFGPNCSSGRSYIIAPERWVTSWEN